MPSEIRMKRLERLALQRASEIVLFELSDPRLTFLTLTRIEITKDLSFGTIYWSTIGTPGDRSKIKHALAKAAPEVQRGIAAVFHTRRSPRIQFEFDPSIEGAIRVSGVLNELKTEREAREAAESEAESAVGAHVDEDVDEDVDADVDAATPDDAEPEASGDKPE